MENKENSLIYTVSTIDYLEQAIVGLKSVKNNNKFKFYFIFLVDIKKESFEKIKKDIKINYPWIELFATHQLNNKYKKLMLRTYKVFSPLEICSISKYIGLKYLTSKFLSSPYFVYIDTDLYFFSSLEKSFNSIKKNTFLITPHYLNPYNAFKELDFLTSGYVNSGFFIAQPACQNFEKILDMLIERISKLGFLAPELGLYCDQNWLNLISHIFANEFCLFKDSGYNIAYWNIENRLISKKRGIYYVNNKKLTFFHFSGFSNNLNERLSVHSNYVIKEDSHLINIRNTYKEEFKKIIVDKTNLHKYNFKRKSLKQRFSLMERELNSKLFKNYLQKSLFDRILDKFQKKSSQLYKFTKNYF